MVTSLLPPAADKEAEGRRGIARATLALSVGQLVSWGVLFYAVAVAAPAIAEDTGWSPMWFSALFSLALLVSGLSAPAVVRALERHGGRAVLTAGSMTGAGAVVLLAGAQNVVVLTAGFVVLGVAMAATLYEPAMAVLVALDPGRRARTFTILSVFGGLASTVYAPLTNALLAAHGWRLSLAVLGITGGLITALLHQCVPATSSGRHGREPAPIADLPHGYRQLRTAQVFEHTAHIATTTMFVALLLSQDVSPGPAALLLATMGFGRTAGRLLLATSTDATGRRGVAMLTGCNVVQVLALLVPLLTLNHAALAVACLVAGGGSGITTVLRPLVLVDLVGVERFAAANARVSRAASFGRAGGPAAVGAGSVTIGWPAAWLLTLALFLAAADRYRAAGRRRTRPRCAGVS